MGDFLTGISIRRWNKDHIGRLERVFDESMVTYLCNHMNFGFYKEA